VLERAEHMGTSRKYGRLLRSMRESVANVSRAAVLALLSRGELSLVNISSNKFL
jgi:hypothetical protein